jgi:hypothetical protein
MRSLSDLIVTFPERQERECPVNEQLQSMEAFEIIVKTWRAASELVAH